MRAKFSDGFAASWNGAAEVDRFNALILQAGLTWRQATVLRAYSRYLRQAGTPYSQEYIEDAVLGHTEVAAALVRLYESRFDPALSDADRAATTGEQIARVTALI